MVEDVLDLVLELVEASAIGELFSKRKTAYLSMISGALILLFGYLTEFNSRNLTVGSFLLLFGIYLRFFYEGYWWS